MALPATFSKEKNVAVCVATMYCRFLTEILERSQVKILKIAAIVYVGFVCVWVIYLPRLYMQNYDAKTNFLMILHMMILQMRLWAWNSSPPHLLLLYVPLQVENIISFCHPVIENTL